jgi:hypothetical protein
MVKLTKLARICPRCRKSGFVLEVGVFRPSFRCEGCNNSWSFGYDGGPYFRGARNVGSTTPLNWVEYPDVTLSRLRAEGRQALEAHHE